MKLLKKARSLDRAGDHAGAAKAYSTFLALEPKQSGVWADYAGQLVQLGRSDEALAACHTALELAPRCLSARNNLGCILMWRDQLDEADQQFRTVLTADRKRLDARLNLAECLLKKKDRPGTRKTLEEAGAVLSSTFPHLSVRHATQWADLGHALLEARDFRGAADACNQALQIDPTNLVAKVKLGAIRMAEGALEDAEAHFRHLIAKHPDRTDVRLLLINCLARKGDYGHCDREIAEVQHLAPRSFEVHTSVTATCFAHGRWDGFRAEVARYRALNVQTHPGLDPQNFLDLEEGFMDLLFGDMPKGWQRYEARLKLPKALRPKRTFDQPPWDGASFQGKTLLVWAEQGLGDTLMFLRYLPQVKALGGRVIVETQPSLVTVAATCSGSDEVVPKGETLPLFDLQVSLMSLPRVFRTDLRSIPDSVPYLNIPREVPNREAILRRLEAARESTRIGVVWAGSPGHVRDIERSLPMDALAPLADLPGVVWYNFQLDRREAPPLPNLIALGPLLSSFADTAYALSGMDLLITVDTSIAHLAGALGIPTLLLLSFTPDFRWLLGREDSPWYPSVRLYRQATYGDWASVIQKVGADLCQEG